MQILAKFLQVYNKLHGVTYWKAVNFSYLRENSKSMSCHLLTELLWQSEIYIMNSLKINDEICFCSLYMFIKIQLNRIIVSKDGTC